MDYESKLALARYVYNEIEPVIYRWESKPKLHINCHWEGFISVGDEIFTPEQLREPDNVQY